MLKILRSFTLIEMLIVVSIIGLLTTLVIVTTSSSRSIGNYHKITADMSKIAMAMEVYKQENGDYPDYTPEWATSNPLVPNYLSAWPEPPCKNYKYLAGGWYDKTELGFARVELKKKGVDQPSMPIGFYVSNRPVYHLCVKNRQDTGTCTCKEPYRNVPGLPQGWCPYHYDNPYCDCSTSIEDLETKSIKCEELDVIASTYCEEVASKPPGCVQ
ncbi:MAG: prepilin-type N-terminal cleavage/methylation domain-containing protein [Candidatus Berkelbacteria bacterium]|nr:prepilin-type N-terminal cleavage/methylation domain-containing protein [Candidatus Berkelbacteria bacterium]